MGEELRITDYDVSNDDDDDRVSEWELGLPTVHDLMPLSQSLVPSELATPFSISPVPHRSLIDVNCISQNTLSNLKKPFNNGFSNGLSNDFKSFGEERVNEMQGLSNEGPSSSDHLFASTPVPQSLQESSGN
ncbi:hypothetical protein HanRHA438_Chr15g0709571 [Helianthus annuus]|uniref:Uncharacterized protein n=1 Tax=Helianthus annuus TaxID=4232 RepID=A0A251U6K3_HELAN|nr:hypothetical protein HanXRQr2_Chr15g0697221 [Helianthus annuus]KAJ0451512.1 putative transcription factor LUX/BOA [Helianthus annuus]KAJ0456051.1 hypothetical protein HanIR_Chr15g0757981 [Helianthus annuus]KAJ0473390.1 putative transcription factor LUX/BOA [Helianthus annuus]KAJ0648974.1 putative transcription factor LUX/BOA [Helianthus annuus]